MITRGSDVVKGIATAAVVGVKDVIEGSVLVVISFAPRGGAILGAATGPLWVPLACHHGGDGVEAAADAAPSGGCSNSTMVCEGKLRWAVPSALATTACKHKNPE